MSTAEFDRYHPTYAGLQAHFNRIQQAQECILECNFPRLMTLLERWYGKCSIFHYLTYFDLFIAWTLPWPDIADFKHYYDRRTEFLHFLIQSPTPPPTPNSSPLGSLLDIDTILTLE